MNVHTNAGSNFFHFTALLTGPEKCKKKRDGSKPFLEKISRSSPFQSIAFSPLDGPSRITLQNTGSIYSSFHFHNFSFTNKIITIPIFGIP
jgi:hypothetical protein